MDSQVNLLLLPYPTPHRADRDSTMEKTVGQGSLLFLNMPSDAKMESTAGQDSLSTHQNMPSDSKVEDATGQGTLPVGHVQASC